VSTISKMVEVDERGRTNLTPLVEKGRTYRVTLHPDGTILLEPARVLTLTEIAVLNNEVADTMSREQ
jgi:hypothetical protein